MENPDETRLSLGRARLVRRLADIEPAAWNALTGGAYPFLRHEFLSALEEQGCLSPRIGWVPRHLVVEDAAGSLVAACPMYLKHNSFGEFVFDWAWAEAYERAGLDYYPKLVVAVPFTPAMGPRVLLAPEQRSERLASEVADAAVEAARTAGVSSLHGLFATDAGLLNHPRFLKRMGYQFHWENRDYAGFDDFLAELTAKRRKEILRERRLVREAGIELRQVRGDQVDPRIWDKVYELYCSTFAKHRNYPALTAEFFRAIAGTMGEQILVVLAERQGEVIGTAYFLVGCEILYGRYWGCVEEIPALHFEACYYQGIEYCIEHRLKTFEPGAQGEHKISRGFLPTRTWSAHWIAEPRFRQAIARFLERETPAAEAYMAALGARSPFKAGPC
jgi:predicted N-acyltransferase